MQWRRGLCICAHRAIGCDRLLATVLIIRTARSLLDGRSVRFSLLALIVHAWAMCAQEISITYARATGHPQWPRWRLQSGDAMRGVSAPPCGGGASAAPNSWPVVLGCARDGVERWRGPAGTRVASASVGAATLTECAVLVSTTYITSV